MYNFAKEVKMDIWYMNGAGNSFCVVDARQENIDMSSMARDICQKRGTDGFMALASSDVADFKLHFYNSDGSRAEMCGNGARCICRFAYENKIAGEKMTVETDAGMLFGERISESIYKVRLNTPQNIILNKKEGVDYAVVGVPHATIKLDSLEWKDAERLFERAKELRYELNANINFYYKINGNTVRILTYERGVEDFTLACGTGSGALASILWKRKSFDGNSLILQNRGGDLKLTVRANPQSPNDIEELYLEGETEILNKFKY